MSHALGCNTSRFQSAQNFQRPFDHVHCISATLCQLLCRVGQHALFVQAFKQDLQQSLFIRCVCIPINLCPQVIAQRVILGCGQLLQGFVLGCQRCARTAAAVQPCCLLLDHVAFPQFKKWIVHLFFPQHRFQLCRAEHQHLQRLYLLLIQTDVQIRTQSDLHVIHLQMIALSFLCKAIFPAKDCSCLSQTVTLWLTAPAATFQTDGAPAYADRTSPAQWPPSAHRACPRWDGQPL